MRGFVVFGGCRKRLINILPRSVCEVLVIAKQALVRYKCVVCSYYLNKCQQCAINKLKVSRQRARVAFFVMHDSVFQGREVFGLMCKDETFDPKIVVVPDISHGENVAWEGMRKTYKSLVADFGDCVELAWRENAWHDYRSEIDICFVMNPYNAMSIPKYGISSLVGAGILVVYSSYSQNAWTIWTQHVFSMPDIWPLWRFYAENDYEKDFLCQYWPWRVHRDRVVVVGQVKTDGYASVAVAQRDKKKIIIAPHHTVFPDDGLQLGNFLKYSDFILKLPKLFPNVEWVFRPHPLLFTRLVDKKVWTQEMVDQYFDKLKSFSNVECQMGGSYCDTFVNSDGLIQDCGSFLPEYFYVGHPQCFVCRSQAHVMQQFLDPGREMLEHVYRAYSEKDIVAFVEEVVLAGKDPMRESRERFARKRLMVNYPHAGEAIVRDIKKAIGRM